MDYLRKHRQLLLPLILTFILYLMGLMATAIGLHFFRQQSTLDYERKLIPKTSDLVTLDGKPFKFETKQKGLLRLFHNSCEAYCRMDLAELKQAKLPKDWLVAAAVAGDTHEKVIENLTNYKPPLPVIIDAERKLFKATRHSRIFVLLGDGTFADTHAFSLEQSIDIANAMIADEDYQPLASGEISDNIGSSSYWRYHRAVGNIFVFVFGFLFLLYNRKSYRDYKPLLWVTVSWLFLFALDYLPGMRPVDFVYGLDRENRTLAVLLYRFVYKGFLFTGLFIWAGYKFLQANLKTSD